MLSFCVAFRTNGASSAPTVHLPHQPRIFRTNRASSAPTPHLPHQRRIFRTNAASSAPTAHYPSAQGNALGFRRPRSRAPTVRDTLARRTTPPQIAALQAAQSWAFPTQGAALGWRRPCRWRFPSAPPGATHLPPRGRAFAPTGPLPPRGHASAPQGERQGSPGQGHGFFSSKGN